MTCTTEFATLYGSASLGLSLWPALILSAFIPEVGLAILIGLAIGAVLVLRRGDRWTALVAEAA